MNTVHAKVTSTVKSCDKAIDIYNSAVTGLDYKSREKNKYTKLKIHMKIFDRTNADTTKRTTKTSFYKQAGCFCFDNN